jgi:hypothetical protein
VVGIQTLEVGTLAVEDMAAHKQVDSLNLDMKVVDILVAVVDILVEVVGILVGVVAVDILQVVAVEEDKVLACIHLWYILDLENS